MRVLRSTEQGADAPRSPLWAVAVLLIATVCQAAPPEIRAIDLRGLQVGGATKLTIDGVHLGPAPRIALDDKLVEAAVDPASNANRLIATVPVDTGRHVGLGVLRVVTTDGASNSIVVGLDRFPQQTIADQPASLPVTLHGAVPGGRVSRSLFVGKAGETVLLEVEARRLGSRLRPVVHVYDPQRREIALARPSVILSGDARAQVRIPADGPYTVEVHDTQYSPPGPTFYRLRIGNWTTADVAWPPVVPRGTSAVVELLGESTGTAAPLPLRPDVDLLPAIFPNAEISGLPPTVRVSDIPEVVEPPEQSAPVALPGVPVGVCGRLLQAGERDRYRLSVVPGTKLLFDVFAEQLGSPVDAVLELRNAQDGVLVQVDDTPTSIDPRLEFAVPAGVDTLDIVVRNNLEQSGPANIYRIVIRPADLPVRDITARVRSDSVNVASGELQVLDVAIDRTGYDGPLQLHMDGLPSGLTLAGAEIPDGAKGTLLAVTNTGTTPALALTRLFVKSPDGAFVRPVRFDPGPDDRTPRWARETLAVAATPKPSSTFALTWANEMALPHLQMHSRTGVPISIQRPRDAFGPVRLSLVTSQGIPLNGTQPNLALAVRLEQSNVEVPVSPAVKAAGDALVAVVKLHAEAAQQAAGLKGDAKVAADAKVQELAEKKLVAEKALSDAEDAAKYQQELAVFVPSVLAEPSVDLSVKAELLNPERNTVLRTLYAPVRRLAVVNPLKLTLNATTFSANLDAKTGATVKLSGTVTRLSGYTGPVTLTLAGLPAGVAAPAVGLKPEETVVAVEVRVPPNLAATEINGLTLTATGPPDPQSGNLPVTATATLAIKLLK